MCGVFAASGKLIDKGLLASLGCFCAARGVDSAGIAWYDGKDITVAKIALHPVVAFTGALLGPLEESTKHGAMIGHTRQATQGIVSDANAHPFYDEGIAFAHNGVLFNDDTFGTYDVDSMALIHGIRKRDFSAYDGSIALVWLEGDTLYAFCEGSPLARGMRDGVMYLASCMEYLVNIGCKSVKELSAGNLYTIKEGKIVTVKRIGTNTVFGYRGWMSNYQKAEPSKPDYHWYDSYNESKWEKGPELLKGEPLYGKHAEAN